MVPDEQALGGQQLPQQLTAGLSKVAGIDAVELLRLGVGILEIVQQGRSRCGSHGGAHVVDVLYLIILHPAKGGGCNAHALTLRLQKAAPGSGGRPLGRGRAHRTVAQGRAELPFCRAEMAGRQDQQRPGRTALAQGSPQRKALGHGAAGPEQPGKGHAQLPHGVAGCRALGLQIPCKSKLHLFLRERRLLQAEPCGTQLQVCFRSFPAGLAKAVVCAQFIELCGQRAFALFFAAHCRPCSNDRRRLEQQGVPAPDRHRQNFSFPAKNTERVGSA